MTGGSKPTHGSKREAKFQDGQEKRGGIKAVKHAGPVRPSKTRPTGTKGGQIQKRVQAR